MDELRNEEYRQFIIVFLLFVYFLFILSDYTFTVVKGKSMSPTFNEGDRIIIKRVNMNEIRRFDIIVFKDSEENKYYIKRVIGLPGDNIIIRNHNEIFVNNHKIKNLTINKDVEYDLYMFSQFVDFKEFEIPKGEFFVLGDNRDNSKDSRQMGTISFEQVEGIGAYVYWPLEKMKILDSK